MIAIGGLIAFGQAGHSVEESPGSPMARLAGYDWLASPSRFKCAARGRRQRRFQIEGSA